MGSGLGAGPQPLSPRLVIYTPDRVSAASPRCAVLCLRTRFVPQPQSFMKVGCVLRTAHQLHAPMRAVLIIVCFRTPVVQQLHSPRLDVSSRWPVSFTRVCRSLFVIQNAHRPAVSFTKPHQRVWFSVHVSERRSGSQQPRSTTKGIFCVHPLSTALIRPHPKTCACSGLCRCVFVITSGRPSCSSLVHPPRILFVVHPLSTAVIRPHPKTCVCGGLCVCLLLFQDAHRPAVSFSKFGSMRRSSTTPCQPHPKTSVCSGLCVCVCVSGRPSCRSFILQGWIHAQTQPHPTCVCGSLFLFQTAHLVLSSLLHPHQAGCAFQTAHRPAAVHQGYVFVDPLSTAPSASSPDV